ncbi:MAG: alpha-amylase family glycosyl hydrolase, partial [Actinomycetota bacterium]|nr:alpha-amylase family glycosyl hydrolase [Actinomycetota bacterium]
GITEHLGYLSDTLGVDAIWISPFYTSPMADFGYDVADYCDVDPIFGNLDDFDLLLDGAHRLGLRVIVDWVPNHTSDQHRWFDESRSSRSNARRDWYVWQDAEADGSPPNNWQSMFGGSAWTFDETTGQHYLHSFLPEQPDLNWRNAEVQVAMFDTLRFWLDRGVDGFRIDVAHFIMKDPDFTDNPLAPPTDDAAFRSFGGYDSWDHIHAKGHADVHAVFRDLRLVLDEYEGDRFSVGEIHIFDWDEWAAYYGDDDELHMPFNFSLVWSDWNAAEIRQRVESLEAALPPHAWPNYVLGNHDEQRLATRHGHQNARSAAVLLLTLRGQPTMYYGDEIGLRETDVPTDRRQDPWEFRVPGMSRDGCRTPMPWTATAGHGFTEPAVEPWLPFGFDAGERNLGAQLADPTSILTLYRHLLGIRKARPSLHKGSIEFIDDVPDGVLGFVRADKNERTIVLINFTEATTHTSVPDGSALLISTDHQRAGIQSGVIDIGPNEALAIDPGSGA